MNVLVTGGAGYVGSVLVPMLLQNGISVKVLDSLKFGGLSLLPYFRNPRFHFIKGDIRDEELVRSSLKGVDAVIHLAGIVGFPACKKDPRTARETHIDGTKHLMRHGSKEQFFVFASTGSVYGQVTSGLCTESSIVEPLTIYGQTKAEAEKIVLDRGNAVVFRYATAFGISPRLRLDLLINDFVYQALRHNQIIIYEKHFKRTFIHVFDMARSMMFALDHVAALRDQIYNVGSENMNRSKEEIALTIKKRHDFFLEFAPTGEDSDKRNYVVSYEKIRAAGFHTTISIEDGIDELVKGLAVVEVANPFSNV